ncbi:MAG: hypothetical protein JWM47_4548 [Acidimicrobiales bacterium]|nr:hypothetical protein [Acidimicrobiales bacterium]
MSIADDLVDAHAPWLTADLETYLRVIGEMFAEVEILAFDSDTDEGWTILFDVSRCRTADLPFLAMTIGEQLPAGITEAAAREWIADAPNARRGTLMSIVRAAQRTLTGGRLVSIRERYGPAGADDDWITVVTYTDETPDPATVERDLRDDVIPGDIELHYETLVGQTWQDVDDDYPTWAAVEAAYANWGEVASDHVGYATFTRPRP